MTPAKTLLAAMLNHKTYAAAAMRFLATLRGSGVAEYFFEFVNFVSRDLRRAIQEPPVHAGGVCVRVLGALIMIQLAFYRILLVRILHAVPLPHAHTSPHWKHYTQAGTSAIKQPHQYSLQNGRGAVLSVKHQASTPRSLLIPSFRRDPGLPLSRQEFKFHGNHMGLCLTKSATM